MTSADPTVTDPMNPQGWNRYSYVGNDPLTFTHPNGLSSGENQCPSSMTRSEWMTGLVGSSARAIHKTTLFYRRPRQPHTA
jgi:hypothetical protein